MRASSRVMCVTPLGIPRVLNGSYSLTRAFLWQRGSQTNLSIWFPCMRRCESNADMDGQGMNSTTQRTPVGTRLRDFGAFQVDISKCATRVMAAIDGEVRKETIPGEAFPGRNVASTK